MNDGRWTCHAESCSVTLWSLALSVSEHHRDMLTLICSWEWLEALDY